MNILIGTRTYSPFWLKILEEQNNPNLIVAPFNNKNILELIKSKNIDYILPLYIEDYTTVKNNQHIKQNIILFPKNNIFTILHNKLKFTKFMKEYFIDLIPTVYILDRIQINDIKFPVISKPIFSSNGNDITIYKNEIEFCNCKNKIIIQEYITDLYEYGAHMLCINGKIINWIITKYKYTDYHIKQGVFPENCEYETDFPIHLFHPILIHLNYSGGICIDFKYNPDTQKINIFEINPRFGGTPFSNNFISQLLYIPKLLIKV